jgi:uncharacterized RDD family membrane protein YckC
VEPVPAGLLRRLGAMIYDALLVLAIWMITLFLLVAIGNSAVGGPLVQSLLFLQLIAFFTYFWVFRGQTLGMLAWRLSIVSDNGYRLTYTQVVLRLVAAMASFACLGLGYLWLFFDSAGRTWPDMFSDSAILYTAKDG